MPFDATGYKTQTDADALRKAADYIERHGWCQHVAKIGDAACLVGAIASVTGCEFNGSNIWTASAQFNRLYDVMEMRERVAIWNDEPERTAAEVIAALRAAADACEQ